jgi:septal ring factor EnvC (AmiA/AmiB activator)
MDLADWGVAHDTPAGLAAPASLAKPATSPALLDEMTRDIVKRREALAKHTQEKEKTEIQIVATQPSVRELTTALETTKRELIHKDNALAATTKQLTRAEEAPRETAQAFVDTRKINTSLLSQMKEAINQPMLQPPAQRPSNQPHGMGHKIERAPKRQGLQPRRPDQQPSIRRT